MDLLKFAVDKLISWPVVAFIIILFFRKPVIGFLSRASKLSVGKEGITLAAAVAAAEGQVESKPALTRLLVDSSIAPDIEKRVQAVKNVGVRPIVQEQEKLIQEELKKLGLPQDEQIEVLVKQLAATQLYARAETTYRTIFGSQIALLKSLNVSGPADRAQLLRFYDDAKARFPGLYQTYSFDQYLHYLTNQGLVNTQDGQRYSITLAGQEFLSWMPSMGLTDDKPF